MAQRGESVNSPDFPRPAALPPLLARRLFLARAALFWEGFWPALMPAAMVAAVFLVLAGFDVWRFVPVWLHWLALAGFAAAFAGALWRGLYGLRWPGEDAATRRLERINGLPHRPLEAAADRLAPEQQDPIARTLWALHRRQALQRLSGARIGVPEAGWWRRDAWGLHAALGLLLVVAWASPGENRAQRIADTLNPGTALPPGAVLALDAWITPPAYTGRAPIFLTRDGKPVASTAALQVPVGSQLQLRLAAPAAGFALRFGKAAHALKAIDGHHAELDLPLDLGQGSTVSLALLRHDSSFAEWPLDIIPDLPPAIRFDGAPKTGRRNTLDIAMAGEDDYGLQKLRVEMTRDGAETPLAIDWPVPPAAAGPVTDKQSFDLLSHPWAGLEVAMTLVAQDAIGQTGRSDTLTVTLPARKFRHPVAKAIVEQRRDLALHPGRWQRVVTALKALTLAPEMYDGDVAAHLGLRMAATRLQLARLPETVASVQALLWQIAVQLEDGRRSPAERDFQALMDRLQDAIDRNADDAEIQRLMQDLRTAMDRMLDEMMRDAMERMARGEQPEMLDDDQQALSDQDMQDMMDRAQDMARMGDRDQAREMLRQLQQMMEAMKNGRLAQMPEGRGNRPGQRGQMRPGQMMQEFGDMLRQQQQLLDRSFRRSQQYGRNGGKPGDNEADGRAQEDLRRRLGEMMNRLAENGSPLPDTLGRADRSMRDARDALKRGEPGDAMQGQTDALDQLRQGLRDLQQAQRGNPDGQAPAADARQNNRNPDRDPFGRTANGYDDNSRDDAVPEIAPVERARRILEELQRRASDRERPAAERDYLDRLLQRF